MDPLSGILHSVRLASSIWGTARLRRPFAVRTFGGEGAIFHAVVRGEALLHRDHDGPLHLERDDIVLLPRGPGHVICDSPERVPTHIADLQPTNTEGIPCLEHGGDGPETFLLCGTFVLDHDAGDTLMSLLPDVLHIPGRNHALLSWFDATLHLMETEVTANRPGVDTVLARLADVLFVQILRAGIESLPEENAGWLAALRDDSIGQALLRIHEAPATRWSAASLARSVGMSRSVFFERFTKLVGEPPAQYLTRWRMQTATDLLKRTRLSNAELADRVGYGSEDAFGKAFKRHVGLTPNEYRSRASA